MGEIRPLIRECAQKIVQFRRDLHQIPETAYTESKTSEYVADCLGRMGLDVQTGIARFGVVGSLAYPDAGKTLLLRSELDALPVTENTGLSFASAHQGHMHACGHDGHMAMVLGAAAVLTRLKPELAGGIKFLFQPAEEGPGGAKPMIEAGVMDSPKVDYALGCHLWPQIPEGCIGVKAGPLMAALDRFDIIVNGKGGHGAMPHLCVDAIDVAAQIVNALQRIVSRHMKPQNPSVVTIGEFKAGTAYNIIAKTACLSGTTRTFDPEVWKSWAGRIDRVVQGICQAMGATYELTYQPGYPVTVNNPWMAEQIGEIAGGIVGADHVVEPETSMGGEDMSFFLDRSKGCFFFLGVGREGSAPLHNSRFDFNEDVLLTGVEIYCRAAIRLLGKRGESDKK